MSFFLSNCLLKIKNWLEIRRLSRRSRVWIDSLNCVNGLFHDASHEEGGKLFGQTMVFFGPLILHSANSLLVTG